MLLIMSSIYFTLFGTLMYMYIYVLNKACPIGMFIHYKHETQGRVVPEGVWHALCNKNICLVPARCSVQRAVIMMPYGAVITAGQVTRGSF